MTDAIDLSKAGAELSRPPAQDMDPQANGGFEEALQQTSQPAETAPTDASPAVEIDERVVRKSAEMNPEFRGLLDGRDPKPVAEPRRVLRELEVQRMTMTRTEHAEYFAKKIEPASDTLRDLRERAYRANPGVWQTRFTDTLDRVDTGYQELNGFLRDYAAGKDFSNEQLLAMQIRSHQILQSVEILSKTVEQSASGMKTIFQTNV